MGINFYLLVINFCIILSGSSSKKSEKLVCEQDSVALVSYLCKPQHHEGDFTIPEDVLHKAQYVKLKLQCMNETWLITNSDVFKKLSYLNTLHINTSKSWKFSDPGAIDRWKHELFAVPNLEILRVTYVKYYNTKTYNWTLTDNLKHLHLENSYMDFDLKTCDNLQSLSLVNTSLNNIPDNHGLNFLTHLDLRKNSLKDMTVMDLASFCSLSYLNIADAVISDCECTKLHHLFADLKKHLSGEIFTVKYNCSTDHSKTCDKFDWTGVAKRRDACLSIVSSNIILHTVLIIIAVSLALIVFIGGFVFGLWYLDKTDKAVRKKPIVKKPIMKKPITTKPIATKPIATKPIATKPIATKPITTKPITTKPITTR